MKTTWRKLMHLLLSLLSTNHFIPIITIAFAAKKKLFSSLGVTKVRFPCLVFYRVPPYRLFVLLMLLASSIIDNCATDVIFMAVVNQMRRRKSNDKMPFSSDE